MFKKIAIVLILVAVVIFNCLRFWKLDTIPNGYHVDETGSADTIECFKESGCDVELTPHPLFGFMEYGQDKPPTYVYPGILWAKLFGSTVPSLRAYSAFVLMIGFVGLFFLGWELLGPSFGLVVVLAATCSPWAWVVNRVALESFPTVVFAIWGLYFFWRSNRWWDWMVAGFLFACAMYAYPPARMTIPLMLVTLGLYDFKRRPIPWPSLAAMAGIFILTLWPMVHQYMRRILSRRFDVISITNPDYLHSIGKTGTPLDLVGIFIHNYRLHLSPDFLFFTGDPSYVHSTRHLGILSWFDIAGLLIFLVFVVLGFVRRNWENPVIKHRRLLLWLGVNFFIGIIPSALTNQELPHALRICGSWPMMMLFSGLMWWSAAELIKALWPLLALMGILSGGVLVYQYFVIYPQESKGMFDFWIKDTAEQLQTHEDWQKFIMYFHRRNYQVMYFMVHRLGMSCKQVHDIWWQLHDDLAKRGQF